jgi:multiple sugar transport system substrate-binding protein
VKWTRMTLLVAAATTLAACGVGGGGGGDAGGEDAGGEDAGGEASGEVLFWHAYGEGPETDALNDTIIPAFEEEHEGVTVEAVGFPYDELRQRLVTSMAGGSLPCLFRSDIIWVPEFAERGILVPLDEEMDDFQEHADIVYEAALATSWWDGNYYGLPLSTNTRALIYNEEVISEAGMDGPPATLDEFRELADALAEEGTAVFVDNETAGWNLLPWIWSNGGDFADEELTQATGHLNGPETVEAVELLHDLYQDGQIPDLIIGAGGRDPAEGVSSGQVATMLDGPWMYPVFEEQFPDFEVQASLMPEGDGGSVSVVGGEDIVMTETCQNRAAAAEFIRYMLGEEAQTALAEAGQMSVRTDMADTLVEIQDYYEIFVDQLETGARPRPPHPEWARMEEIMKNQVQTAFQGRQTVQEALDAAAEEIDTILQQEG